MSQNLSGNGYVLTHCLEPKGPAFSGETQCKQLELGCPQEKSDHHFMKDCQCRVTHPAEITLGFVSPTYISVVVMKSHLAKSADLKRNGSLYKHEPARQDLSEYGYSELDHPRTS